MRRPKVIQVLGLRPSGVGATRPVEVFFEKGWRFSEPMDIFNSDKLDLLLKEIPEDERYNLFFTVAHCFEQKGRKMKEQWLIPFDIDGIDLPAGREVEEAERVARTAAAAIGIDYKYLSVVYSGHGVQFFIHLTKPFIDDKYFDNTRTSYGLLATKINEALKTAGINGKTDTSVWSKARLMRLPNTENRKKNKPPRKAQLIQQALEPIEFTLEATANVAHKEESAHITDAMLKQYPKPDTKAVCDGCKFLTWCNANQGEVKEPQWYAMTSITARLDNGSMLTHEYSKKHPDYTEYETDVKIEQALSSAGPRTCKNIESIWDGCKECDNYNKVTSPIMIRGKDFLISQDFGFRQRIIKKVGESLKVTPGAPEYDDLIKFFFQQFKFKVIKETVQVIVYNGVHWQFFLEPEIRAWMTSLVIPSPSSTEMNEFTNRLRAHNLVSSNDLFLTREGMVNFSNCVLNFVTGETFPHSPEYGFFDVRPFAYDPQATSPVFDKFLLDVMQGDQDLADSLKEFGGYCVSGDNYWYSKALVLLGTGRNGKSIFMRTLGKVVGSEMVSAISIQDLKQPTMAHRLVNKCFNYSEETSEKAFADSEFLKKLTDGALITVKQLYVQPYEMVNKAKIIISANTMPYSYDNTPAFYRRLLILKFNQHFAEGSSIDDPAIESKLEKELPGICNILLANYRKMKDRGSIIGHSKIMQAVEEYKSNNDVVLMFIDNCVNTGLDETIGTKASELYERYVQFCDFSGFRADNITKFGREFKRHTGLVSQSVRLPQGVSKVYKGIQIRKEF